MASGYVQVPADSTGKKVDCVSLSAGGNTVMRQTVVVGDPTASAGFATVTGGKLNVNASVGTVTVTGQVSVTGSVAISNTVTVSGQVSVTGSVAVSNNLNISNTPSVVIAAGTANIGSINNISATVSVFVTNSLTIGTFTPAINISNTPSVIVTNALNISNTPSMVIAAFTDPSGTNRNVVDSSNLALRVNVVAGGAGGGVVTGPSAPGASVTAGNAPVLMGGVDPSSLARVVRVDATGGLIVSHISATVNVAGSFTVGSQAAGQSVTAANSMTLIGGYDGSFARVALTDSGGKFVITGTVALAGGSVSIGSIVYVAGVQAAGTSGTGNYPVLIGGLQSGDTGNVHIAKVDASGNFGITGTVAVTGTLDKISATVVIAGEVAAGSSLSTTNKPVLMGGNDSAGGGIARSLLVDTSGRVILGAGAQNIGTINNISATVGITGTVQLVAGTANIGTLNNISATVLAQVTNNINISNTPSVIIAAGTANIGSINNISATVSCFVTNTVSVNLAAQSAGFIIAAHGAVAFNASITAGNAPILAGGRVKTSISTTATAHAAVWAWFDKAGHQIVQLNAASLHPSATHGPKTVTLSASANTVLVASAGTACVFVDSIMVTSNLAAVTRVDVYETPSSAAPEVSAYLATGGGGFTHKFDPPWQLSAGQALSARLKPSASAQVLVTVHFHVGPA